MGKVLIFNGSPKKRGTTASLLAQAADGAKSKGLEVVEYNLNDASLRGCQGCMACRKEDAVACVQNDYFSTMYADLKDADGIIFGAPIYMGSITAQGWKLINRLYPAMAPDFSPRFPGKNFGIIITHGAPDAEAYKPAAEVTAGFFARLGWNEVGRVIWAGAGGEAPEELSSQAFAMGEAIAR
ncbi:MAG: flavodoxin family protein [Eubacteriaceae bacterium]|nr:flavodoxin family protein [Eubacteriaceae bacterium]